MATATALSPAPAIPPPPPTGSAPPPHGLHEKMSKGPGAMGMLIFGAVLIAGIIYIGYSLSHDLIGVKNTSALPYILLGVALFVALAFEFVNGFHDTANAVATVIYTHSLDPQIAVTWSGFCNFIGVVLSSGAVAFGIVSLLPVELILQVGSAAGYAMVRGLFQHKKNMLVEGMSDYYYLHALARVEFAHVDRFDYRRGHRQPIDAGAQRNQRRGLGAGGEHWKVAGVVPHRGIFRGWIAVAGNESDH